MRKWHSEIMEVLQILAFIIVVLDVDLLKLMQFNDLHLSYTFYRVFCKTCTDIYEKCEHVDGVLGDVKTSRSHISTTTYPIDMKFIEVM